MLVLLPSQYEILHVKPNNAPVHTSFLLQKVCKGNMAAHLKRQCNLIFFISFPSDFSQKVILIVVIEYSF